MGDKTGLVGRTYAGYVVERKIGSGGMGVVYAARDERLGRTVALKILPPNLSRDETTRLRFVREGRTSARIDHANVVRVLAAGEAEGFPYIVQEYVDGGTLQQRMDRFRKLPLADALRIASQVAAGLGAAHKAGILHRDVKPANVLFTREGEAKLADFGLAREENSNVNISVPGMVMGTPHFMAPEVCEGSKADARSDLYGLGVMLYYMISGRYPFDGEAVMQVLMAHVQEVAPPLVEAPEPVAAAVDRMMSKRAVDRYQTAEEVIKALDEAAKGRPVTKPPQVQAIHAATTSRKPASSPSGTAQLASATAAIPPAALPRAHLIAYSVAGVTLFACAALLIWAFAFNTDPAPVAPGPGKGAKGAGAVPVPEEEGREEKTRWESFVARARQAGAEPKVMLAELEKFREEPAAMEAMRAELLGRWKATLVEEIRDRGKKLVLMVASDIGRAEKLAAERGSWGEVSFAAELVQEEIRVEGQVWDAILEAVRAEAAALEEKSEFRRALEVLEARRPPQPDRRAALLADIGATALRARTAAEKAIQAAPPGAAGAESLRALAGKMPREISEVLKNAAYDREQESIQENPLDDLAGLVRTRDFEAILRQLELLESRGRVDPATLAGVRTRVRRSRDIVKRAMESYGTQLSQTVTVERADGTKLTGNLYEVADTGESITLEIPSRGPVVLAVRDISELELAARALGPFPSNELVLWALDFGLTLNSPLLTREMAARTVRRGMPLPASHQGMIARLLAGPDLERLKVLVEEIKRTLENSPESGGALAREFFDRFRDYPVDAPTRIRARALLMKSGSRLDLADLRRFTRAHVTSFEDGSFSLKFAPSDLLLEDFAPEGTVRITEGPGFTIEPGVNRWGTFYLSGLTWKNVKMSIKVQAQGEGWFAALAGIRNPWESIGSAFVLRASPADSLFAPPHLEPAAFPSPGDGWHTLVIDFQSDGAYVVTVNDRPTRTRLPVSWPGEVGFFITSRVTLGDIEITGRPAWSAVDMEKEFQGLQEAAESEETEGVKVPFGSWLKKSSALMEVDLDGTDEEVTIRPPKWAHGNDWIIAFEARLEGRGTKERYPEMHLDFRTTGKTVRRLKLAGQSQNGFMADGKWMRAGMCADIELGEFQTYVLIVRGDVAMLVVNEKLAWAGHMGPATAGGPALGVVNGKLTLRNLHVKAMPK